MCLIMYSPDGQLIDREVFYESFVSNPDGIGIMSEAGIQKYTGKRAAHRAYKALRKHFADGRTPYAVHHRWATHGDLGQSNVHPHTIREDVYLMHNGVLANTGADGKSGMSDTAIYVKRYLSQVSDFRSVSRLIGDHIGASNKFVILEHGEFTIVNEESGFWLADGTWISNDYSIGIDTFERVLGPELADLYLDDWTSKHGYLVPYAWEADDRAFDEFEMSRCKV